MGATTIEWCDFTFNHVIGCTKIAAGCTRCYAESFAKRFNKAAWGPHGTRVKTSEANWRKPLKWNREAFSPQRCTCGADRTGPSAEAHDDDCPANHRPRVFCASLADVFEDWPRGKPIVDSKGRRLWIPRHGYVWDEPIPESAGYDFSGMRPLRMVDLRESLFYLIDQTQHLDWLLLTKRPENVRKMWPAMLHSETQPRDRHRGNVWIGCSISDQATADKNIPELLKLRDLSPVLFVSAEPLLGPVDIRHWLEDMDFDEDDPDDHDERDMMGAPPTLDWLIIGGESGHGARMMRLDWARSLVEQCKAAAVSCFVKQLGANPYAPGDWETGGNDFALDLRDRKGGDPDEWPEDLRVRQFPAVEVHA